MPFTLNHKPTYDHPRVRLLYYKGRPQEWPSLDWQGPRRVPAPNDWPDISPERFDLDTFVQSKLWQRLSPRVRFLIRSRRAYAFEQDRSRCIFELITGLYEAEASLGMIANVLWANPYFVSKHGQNLEYLNGEIRRVVFKLENNQ